MASPPANYLTLSQIAAPQTSGGRRHKKHRMQGLIVTAPANNLSSAAIIRRPKWSQSSSYRALREFRVFSGARPGQGETPERLSAYGRLKAAAQVAAMNLGDDVTDLSDEDFIARLCR